MKSTRWLLLIALFGCDNEPERASPASSTASSAPALPPAFDIEGFCEKSMAVGRTCEGEDEFMEGNKVGLCASTLRAARDDDGAKLDAALAEKCLASVASAKPPLPDVRTLKTLAERFDTCRAFAKVVPSLRDVSAVSPGTNGEGDACKTTAECGHGLFCDQKCVPQKKAGESCTKSHECKGRCSRKSGNTCVSYCGSG